MKKYLSALLLFIVLASYSQDTISLIHYNLLNFGNYTSYCTSNNNNVYTKTGHLKTIISYATPDIFTVNELFCSTNLANLILDDALNVDGTNHYKKAEITCHSPYSSLTNMLYYNSDLLGLKSQSYVETNIRDINIYKLFYKGNLPQSEDTIFFSCIVAHLKAGDDSDDEIERADEISKLNTHLANYEEPGNFLFMGDFNVYKSSEQAFQKIIYNNNEDFRFYDPINKIGYWHNNSYFEKYHTQSTHYSGGCPAGGGMDVRFDFILVSESIKDATDGIMSINSSYWAIGQDGLHFNKSIKASPTNTSVPSQVLNALYNLSDHLPVRLNLLVGEGVGIKEFSGLESELRVINTSNQRINIFISTKKSQSVNVEIYDLAGRKFSTKNFSLTTGNNSIYFDVPDIPAGAYILKFSFPHGLILSRKLIF